MTATPSSPRRIGAIPLLTAMYAILALPGGTVLLWWATGYFRRSWSVLTFPYGYDYGEAPELQRALAVAHLLPFYPFWNAPPYQMANYTPLYSVLNGAFVRFLGVQFQSGRAISWVCGLLFCAGLAWLASREGKTWLAPVVTVLLWFSSHYVWNWTPLAREDELAMLFSIGGLIAFYEGVVRRPRLHAGTADGRDQSAALPPPSVPRFGLSGPLWVALLLFVGAIYTRQTTIEAAAACCLYLLIRQPRRGLRFVLVFALVGGGIFAILDIVTRGAFYLNIVTGNRNLYHWQRVMGLGHQFWAYYQAAALLAGFYVLTQIVSRRHMLLVLWLLITFGVAVTVGKEGASDNYLLLPWGAISLTAGLAVARALTWSGWLWTRSGSVLVVTRPVALIPPFLTGFLLLLHAQLTFHLPYQGQFDGSTIAFSGREGVNGVLKRATDTGWYRRVFPGELPPAVLEGRFGYMYKPSLGVFDRQEQQRLVTLVAGSSGDVFDEDMTHVLQAGKRIYIQPFEFAEEARLGQWDQRPFLASIQQGHFSLVVTSKQLATKLNFERYTSQMAATFTDSYCLAAQTSHYYVYRPCGS